MKERFNAVFKYRKVRFISIGAINTIIDFVALNILTLILGVPKIPANLISVTIAMTFSFFANRNIVFKTENNHKFQVINFILVTVFGLYVIQTLVMYILTDLWTWPLESIYSLVQLIGLGNVLSEEFVIINGAKVVATLFTIIWNYKMYKKVVFNENQKSN